MPHVGIYVQTVLFSIIIHTIMTHTITHLLVGILLLCHLSRANAQIYYVDGRTVCCGDLVTNLNNNAGMINPANLGAVQVKSSSFNMFQVGFNSHSNTLDRAQTLKMFLPFSNDSLSTATRNQITDNIINNNGQLKFNGNLNINWLSMSWTRPKFGGLAISLTERINSHFGLQPSIANSVINGSNAANYQIGTNSVSNSQVRYSHLRELSASYGRQAADGDVVKAYIGGNFRYVWGIGFLDLDVQDSLATGSSAFSDFYNLDYGNLDTLFQNVKRIFGNAGTGYNFSVGANVIIKNRLFLGASALGVGKVKWNKNVLQAQDQAVNYPAATDTSQQGIPSYSLQDNSAAFYDMFDFEPKGDTLAALAKPSPSNLRINVAYRVIDQLKVYSDILLPLNGKLSGQVPNYIFGLDYAIIPEAFYVSGGVQFSKEFSFRVPVGTAFSLSDRGFISISTGDLRTLLNGGIKEPYAAISVSLVNANIGGAPVESYPASLPPPPPPPPPVPAPTQ